MSVISIATNTDFSLTDITAVTQFSFVNPARTTVRAIVDDSHVVLPSVMVAGSAGVNFFTLNNIHAPTPGFVFSNWSAADKIVLNGTGGNDTMVGTLFADVVHGGAGKDLLQGFDAKDQIFGDAGNDQILLGLGTADGGAGIDAVDFIFQPAQLVTSINVDLSDGGGGREIVPGLKLSGFERLISDLTGGNDTVIGGIGGDHISANAGDDQISGFSGNDKLEGRNGNDTLNGGTGADALTGGVDADLLTGGSGADRFVFLSVNEIGTFRNFDTITDFEQGLDLIDLHWIDGRPFTTTVNEKMIYIGQTAFLPDSYYQVRWDQTANETVVQISLGAEDRDPIFELHLTSLYTLTAADFIL